MQRTKATLPTPSSRVLFSLGFPILGALVLISLLGPSIREQTGTTLFLAGLGIASLLLGLYWYGLPALGLRGHRALYAGIGFATLGWIGFFLARLFLVSSNTEILVSSGFGRIFVYLLLFEALSLQLWTFGLVFRSIADWRGPLTAAIASGLLFGTVAFLFFDEALVNSLSAVLYFVLWGVFYGLIRLRTGGIVGIVIVQAMQSVTAWHILLPEQRPDINELQNLYLAAGLIYLLFIWRLWPKEEDDYRV